MQNGLHVLVVGGGGREHAIVWKLAQSPLVEKISCAPGNAGIAELAACHPVAATDLEGILELVSGLQVDYVLVAPDDPLAMGLVDRLQALNIPAFGPVAAAARLESSKSFAKDLMKKYRIPTADYQVFTDLDAALAAVQAVELPVVVKADGLALGKGVVIAQTRDEAAEAVRRMMQGEAFGDAGRTCILETCLTGAEMTLLCFCDGETIVPMVSSRDHKRALDGDLGPNTGGMGAIAPAPDLTPALLAQIQREILEPTVRAMRELGSPFSGVLYVGLMLTADGPRVIEYNARFGDPEAQVVLPLLTSDLMEICLAVTEGRLRPEMVSWSAESACCVVMASGGYPGTYRKGVPISGLDEVTNSLVFHAGTRKEQGACVTAGGRVLGVTALGDTLGEAIGQAYDDVAKISFDQAHYRRDIGRRT